METDKPLSLSSFLAIVVYFFMIFLCRFKLILILEWDNKISKFLHKDESFKLKVIFKNPFELY